MKLNAKEDYRTKAASDEEPEAQETPSVGFSFFGLLIKTVAVTVFILGYLMPPILVRGWVLSQLWTWFAEPMGVPRLSVASAVGASLVIATLKANPDPKDDPEKDLAKRLKKLTDGFVMAIAFPLITLAIGAIVVRFFR